jgi:NADPH-dependent curcumin reductase CurA
VHYVKPQGLDETVMGVGGIARVVKSAHPDVRAGEELMSPLVFPWKKYFVIDWNAKLAEGWIKVCIIVCFHYI